MTHSAFTTLTGVTCDCDRVGGHRHNLAPGCPGMDGPVQFIPGPEDGTLIVSAGPRPRQGEVGSHGAVSLIPHTPEERAEIARLQGREVSTDVDVSELVRGFLAQWELEVEPADSTYGDRKSKLRIFASENPTLPRTADEIASWLRNHYPNPTSTRHVTWGHIAFFYAFLVDKGMLSVNPLEGAHARRVKKTLKSDAAPAPRFSENECRALIGAIDHPVVRAHVYLCLGQGWRAEQEPMNLLVKDIGEDQILVRGKERDEFQPLLPEVGAVLRPLCEGKRPDEPVLGYRRAWLAKQFNQLCVHANVSPKPPKALRTTASSLWSASGGSGVALDIFMRHKIPGMRGVYSQVTEQEFRRLFEQNNPLRAMLYGNRSAPLTDAIAASGT